MQSRTKERILFLENKLPIFSAEQPIYLIAMCDEDLAFPVKECVGSDSRNLNFFGWWIRMVSNRFVCHGQWPLIL